VSHVFSKKQTRYACNRRCVTASSFLRRRVTLLRRRVTKVFEKTCCTFEKTCYISKVSELTFERTCYISNLVSFVLDKVWTRELTFPSLPFFLVMLHSKFSELTFEKDMTSELTASPLFFLSRRPTRSIIYVPLLVNRFQKSILLIVQYTYFKSCPRDWILQNLILRTRLCSIGFITQSSWLLHFHPTKIVALKCVVPLRYHVRRGKSGGPALKYYCVMHRVGRVMLHGKLSGLTIAKKCYISKLSKLTFGKSLD